MVNVDVELVDIDEAPASSALMAAAQPTAAMGVALSLMLVPVMTNG